MAENKTENPGTEEMEVRLAQLNQFTRRTLTQEEVFLFDVRLCDNEIDRDGERFSLEALEQLKTLFVGKTGIFDHNPKGENQTEQVWDAAAQEMLTSFLMPPSISRIRSRLASVRTM